MGENSSWKWRLMFMLDYSLDYCSCLSQINLCYRECKSRTDMSTPTRLQHAGIPKNQYNRKVSSDWNLSSLKLLLVMFQPNMGLPQETQVIFVRGKPVLGQRIANKDLRELWFQRRNTSLWYSCYTVDQIAFIRHVNRTFHCNTFIWYVIGVSLFPKIKFERISNHTQFIRMNVSALFKEEYSIFIVIIYYYSKYSIFYMS